MLHVKNTWCWTKCHFVTMKNNQAQTARNPSAFLFQQLVTGEKYSDTHTHIRIALQSTSKEMIPATNAIDAHAYDFVVMTSGYYPSCKHAHNTLARCSNCLIFAACLWQQIVSRSYRRQSPLQPTPPLRTAPDTPLPADIISWSAIYTR